MRRWTLTGLLMLACTGAFGQSYGGYRDNPYYGGPSRDNRVYSGSYGANPVDRAIDDLQRAASTSYYARKERGHFDHALRELSKFQNKSAQGRFDRHALDEGIGELSHLAGSRYLDPRLRETMARNADELRDFRANGAYPSPYGGRGYDPDYRR